MKLIRLILTVLILCPGFGYSQVSEQINYALKSHETLEIKRIETVSGKTVIWLSVENRIRDGQFCADKNLFIVYPDGTRSKLISSNGIPVCPDSYKFKRAGERLDFSLTFPRLKDGTEWFDLIEDCSENCFSFYGVTLDADLNKHINQAMVFAVAGENGKSISEYIRIIENLSGKHHGMEGSLYADLISLLVKDGKMNEAKAWYSKMVSSGAPRLDLYVNNLNSRGIKF